MAELIRLEHLTRTFTMPGGGGEVPVLRDIDLTVDEGEFLALQGTSGSGKSTLLSILGLLDRQSAGRYLLRGRDVSALSDDELSDLRNQAIGFVFQSFHLIPYATALENVLLPGMYGHTPQGKLRRRAEELLARVGLSDRKNFRPGRLSGGQQQRVAMARAMLNDPDLLLADEPTGQLDSATSAGIMELFTEINATGKTVILVTHDAQVAATARRIVRLADGRVQGGEGA